MATNSKTSSRRFPAPWSVEKTEGAFIVRDANGQAVSWTYWREPRTAADIAKVLSEDEARRIARKIAKLPGLFTK